MYLRKLKTWCENWNVDTKFNNHSLSKVFLTLKFSGGVEWCAPTNFLISLKHLPLTLAALTKISGSALGIPPPIEAFFIWLGNKHTTSTIRINQPTNFTWKALQNIDDDDMQYTLLLILLLSFPMSLTKFTLSSCSVPSWYASTISLQKQLRLVF